MKMDPKLVASKQKSELAYICNKFKVKRKELLRIMASLGSNGKLWRGRGKIYIALRAEGYVSK